MSTQGSLRAAASSCTSGSTLQIVKELLFLTNIAFLNLESTLILEHAWIRPKKDDVNDYGVLPVKMRHAPGPTSQITALSWYSLRLLRCQYCVLFRALPLFDLPFGYASVNQFRLSLMNNSGVFLRLCPILLHKRHLSRCNFLVINYLTCALAPPKSRTS